MDLLRGAGCVLFFMIKQNLGNNMMISKLWTTITIQIRYSSEARLCSSEASWWAGGTHDQHNSAPELAEHPPPPYQIMLDPSLSVLYPQGSIWKKYRGSDPKMSVVVHGRSFDSNCILPSEITMIIDIHTYIPRAAMRAPQCDSCKIGEVVIYNILHFLRIIRHLLNTARMYIFS